MACLLAVLALGTDASATPEADSITRVTVHQEGTALEIFRRITAQVNVFLDWSGPADGPRLRFDAEREPFWPTILRACKLFGTHIDTVKSVTRLPIGNGTLSTRIVSDSDAAVTLIMQEGAALVRQPDPGDDRGQPDVVIRVTACFDPALRGAIAAYGNGIDVENAVSDKGDSLSPSFRRSIGMYCSRPEKMLVMHLDTWFDRSSTDARRLARLHGTIWFVAQRKTESVHLELVDGAAGPKPIGGATARVDIVASAPAERRDIRVRVERGTLSDGCWVLIRPQIVSSLEASLLTRSGRAFEGHPATHVEDLDGWNASDTALDAIFRFEALRAAEPACMNVSIPTGAMLIKVPLTLTDVDLPSLPPPAKK